MEHQPRALEHLRREQSDWARAATLKRRLGEAHIPIYPGPSHIVPVMMGHPVHCTFVLQSLSSAVLLDGHLKARTMVLPDRFIDHDAPDRMYARAGLDAAGIVAMAMAAIGGSRSAIAGQI